MTAPKSRFNFQLQEPLKYHKNGEVVESYELELKAPSKKNRKQAIRLKQGFFSAMKYHQENSKVSSEETEKVKKALEAGDDKISASEIIMMLYMSDVDMEKLDDAFCKLLLQEGVCLVDGEIQLTEPTLENISDEDLDSLLGEYLENFFVGSMMQKMK